MKKARLSRVVVDIEGELTQIHGIINRHLNRSAPNAKGVWLSMKQRKREENSMREHKCRGQRLDSDPMLDGAWVEGFLYEDITEKRHLSYIIKGGLEPATSIPSWRFIEVHPETVGEYTGLKDSKRTEEYPEGQKIWERDQLSAHTSPTYTVVWSDIEARWCMTGESRDGGFQIPLTNGLDFLRVIGTIHDKEGE